MSDRAWEAMGKLNGALLWVVVMLLAWTLPYKMHKMDVRVIAVEAQQCLCLDARPTE